MTHVLRILRVTCRTQYPQQIVPCVLFVISPHAQLRARNKSYTTSLCCRIEYVARAHTKQGAQFVAGIGLQVLWLMIKEDRGAIRYGHCACFG